MADDEVLFSITDKNLDSGLRGVPVGTCQTSFVDPYEGVHYVGYPVEDLVDMEEEDVIFLLFNKRLPTEEEMRQNQSPQLATENKKKRSSPCQFC